MPNSITTNAITWRAVATVFGAILMAGGGFYASTSSAQLATLNEKVVALEVQAVESEKRRVEQQEVLREIRAGVQAMREEMADLRLELERRR